MGACEPDRAAAYLEDRAVVEFAPGLVAAFFRLLRRSDVEMRVLGDEPERADPPA